VSTPLRGRTLAVKTLGRVNGVRNGDRTVVGPVLDWLKAAFPKDSKQIPDDIDLPVVDVPARNRHAGTQPPGPKS